MTLATLADAKELLGSNDTLTFEQSFELSKLCITLLKNRDREQQGREIAIRVLDNRKKLPSSTESLWNDIVEMSGLYPYLEPGLLSPSALMRYECHRSKHLQDVYFHEEQNEISQLLRKGNSVILSAPTSFGKSLLIEDVIASRKFKNVVIIQPTLALLDETRKKLSKYKDVYNVIVSTSQVAKLDSQNIFLFTGERVVEYSNFPDIDFFVIDEFYKLSLNRDDDRAVTLNQAFHKLLKHTNKFYLLGPVIKSIPVAFQKKLDVGIRYTNFSTVAIDEIPVLAKGKEKADDKEKRLYELLKSLDEPTLIYCSAPEKASKIANNFANALPAVRGGKPRNQDMIEWINENINSKWYLANCLSKGVAFHSGILPRHLGSSIVDAFNNKEIKYLFCTSTLIEGVNTTAKNIVLFDNTKGKNIPIDFFDYKNIAGRSGRMRVHFTGRIFKFYDTPPQLELEVDIPFVTQTNAPDELLIQLDRRELTKESKDKLKKYDKMDDELMSIIRSNNGVSIEGQLSVVDEIENNLKYYHSLLNWRTFPTYKQLAPVTELLWKHLLKSTDSKANVKSAAQLATYAIQYSILKSIGQLIDQQANSGYWLNAEPDDDARVNRVAFNILNAARHWFDYKLPKMLTTISKLQSYVFTRHGMRAGDYSLFAAAIENGFLSSQLTTLLEYDIPMSAIRKLSGALGQNDDFDVIFRRLRQLNLDKTSLNNYEKRKLKQII